MTTLTKADQLLAEIKDFLGHLMLEDKIPVGGIALMIAKINTHLEAKINGRTEDERLRQEPVFRR